jgi:hypothetical protein
VTLRTKKPFDDVLAAARASCTSAPIKMLVQTIADAAPDSSSVEALEAVSNKFYILFEFEHWTW